MPDDSKPTTQKPSQGNSRVQEAEKFLNCVEDERKLRMDAIIQQLKSGTGGGFGIDPTPAQESHAMDEARDACEHLPGSQYFLRTR